VSLIQPSWVVFVGGSSGSGKTTLAAAIAQAHDSVRYVSASDLIRESQGLRSSVARPEVADEAQAEALQATVIERFAQYRAAGGDLILLDGHFVVPTASGFYRVSPGVFASLGCDALVLVEAAAETVTARLKTRGGAYWWDGTTASASEAINCERAHMEHVARTLRLPAARIDSTTPGADALLWELIGRLRPNE
jgi:adenylate kinase